MVKLSMISYYRIRQSDVSGDGGKSGSAPSGGVVFIWD